MTVRGMMYPFPGGRTAETPAPGLTLCGSAETSDYRTSEHAALSSARPGRPGSHRVSLEGVPGSHMRRRYWLSRNSRSATALLISVSVDE